MLVDYNMLFYASIGGLILGAACTLNYVIRGKDTGMTRIAFNISTFKKQELPQMFAMLGGMFTISSILFIIYGNSAYNGFVPFGPDKDITTWTSLIGFSVSGLFVGFGAKLCGGCTSGHGLCGLPRFSLRSFVAICMFLIAGIGISSYAVRNGLGPLVAKSQAQQYKQIIDHKISSKIVLVIGIILPIISLAFFKFFTQKKLSKKEIFDKLVVYIIGGIFSLGLIISGMSRRVNVLGFLQFGTSYWNPSLLLVLGFGVGINLISFAFMRKRGVSLNGNKVFNPVQEDKKVDWRTVIGGLCFGFGWGLGGICPGPFYVLFSVFTIQIQVFWGLSFVIGTIIGSKLQKKAQVSKIQKLKQAIGIKDN